MKLVLLVLLLLPIPHAKTRETLSTGNFTVNGSISTQDISYLVLSYYGSKGLYVDDTCPIKNGKFTFYGSINGPVYSFLRGYDSKGSNNSKNSTNIFLEPGNLHIKLKENAFADAIFQGSKTQLELDTLNASKINLNRQESELDNQLTTAAEKDKDEIRRKIQECQDMKVQMDIAFIRTHTDSYLSAYNLEFRFTRRELSLDSTELLYNRMTERIKHSSYCETLSTQIADRKLSAVGNNAPLFSMPDINGKMVILESYRHKSYVLLDFWASWCVPCRALTPAIMDIYKKYHERGFEVIGLSYDKDTAAMCQAIRQDSTGDWRQIYLNLFHPVLGKTGGELLKRYSIESIPSLVLIDKEGKIIGRYRGNGDEGGEQALYNKLNSLFENNHSSSSLR
jgi:thiol-disulfide isomerase/thioredoxin